MIDQTLLQAQQATNIEIIVVDGGSTDSTAQQVQNWPVKLLLTPPGRALQMNRGAEIATGEILLFLHGDTCLPSEFDRQVRQTLAKPATIAGAFRLKIDDTAPGLRWVEWMANLRSRFLQLPYGDQALFLQKKTFVEMGGFPKMPIMEDFELICQLKRRGQITIVPDAVLTSGRRWQKLGVCKTTLINQLIVLGYWMGVPPIQLVKWYRGQK